MCRRRKSDIENKGKDSGLSSRGSFSDHDHRHDCHPRGFIIMASSATHIVVDCASGLALLVVLMAFVCGALSSMPGGGIHLP